MLFALIPLNAALAHAAAPLQLMVGGSCATDGVCPTEVGISGTYAGYSTPINSPYNPGMAPNSHSNAYYWDSEPWTYQAYDMNGSYLEPDVDGYARINTFSGPGAGLIPPPA